MPSTDMANADSETGSTPKRGNVIDTICEKFHGIPSCVACLLVIILQDVVMDFYLVKYNNPVWFAWIVPDVVVFAAFVAAFVWAFIHMKHIRRKKKKNPDYKSKPKSSPGGELPMAYVAWGIYSIILAAKLGIIFKSIAYKLNEKDLFGPNMLKMATGLTALVFFLLVSTHHDAPNHSDRKHYIDSMTHGVALDLFDSASILEILFFEQSRIELPFSLHNAIIAIACINMMLPTVPLLSLSRTQYGQAKMTNMMKNIHTLLYLLAVNVPNMVVRVIIWHGLDKDVSIFLMKNILMVIKVLYDVYESICDEINKRAKAKQEPEGHEMSDKMMVDAEGVAGNRGKVDKGDEPDAADSDDKITEL